MRRTSLAFPLLCLGLFAAANTAAAQPFSLHVSAGPTLVDRGYSLAGGFGYSPASRLMLSVDVERTHLSSTFTGDRRGGSSAFRGGTTMLVGGQLRVAPFGQQRVGPYGLVGFAAGRSTPNVNRTFPDAVTNGVQAFFFGGGLLVPLGERVHLFGDARMMVGAEAGETFAVAPLRVGMAWRF